MTNPLSSYGYSDEDYETAIGMMVGESSPHSRGQTLLHEMAGQLDVALNRLGSHQTGGRTFGKGAGPSLTNVILSPSQFDAATKTKGRAHREQYSPAKRAALDDEYLATLTPNMQSRVLAAREAALKTAGTKELRGITKNATTTSSTAYKLSPARAREHNKEGRKTATKIGGTSFYGKGHDRKRSQEQAAAISTKLDQRASTSAPRADTPKERNLSGMTASRGTPAAAAPDVSMGRFYDAPATPAAAAPYSPANLDFGPDFTSPPSQARGPVTDPYGFSNVDTAAEAVPGSFANFGPNAFGALDQAPVDYGTTYPDISAGLYPDITPPDVPPVPDIMGQFDPTNMMTEQQAIENANLEGQRPSENVSIQNRPYGESIDQQVARNAAAAEELDFLAASTAERMAPFGVRDNPASYTTNPYEIPSGPMPDRFNAGIWGGQGRFNDTYNATNRATPTFVDYENRAPLAGLGLGPMGSPGPVGMARAGGVELQRDISGISAGMYPYEAVIDAVRNAPVTPSPMTIENFNAIFGDMPSDETGAVRGSRAGPQAMSFAPAVNAPQAGGPYGFSSLQSLAPTPDAATIPNDVTGYGAGGAFGTRAPSPAFDFADIVNNTQWSGAAPANAPAPAAQEAAAVPTQGFGRETPASFNDRMSDLLSPGMTGGMTPFSPTQLGMGHGFIDQGPYTSPIGPTPYTGSFSSPIAIDRPAATPSIIGYEPGKTITRDVPNPAWSDWSREYGTKNALQDAWLAADEDKFGRDTIRSSFVDRPIPEEPARYTTETRIAQGAPIYGPAPNPAASVPAINAQPVSSVPQVSTWSPGMTQQAQNFSSLLGSIGGYGLQGVSGTFDTGFSLADLGGGYGGYGAWGGGYDPGGYGGGYGGTAPGDAGYGSDARSGSGNMGAGNLYQ